MAANGYVDACGFTPASGGTGNFVVSTALLGFQTPAAAGAVNAVVYSYRAQSLDLTQWEEGFGAYTVGTTTLARTTITANSLGTTAAVSFSTAPNVYITALSVDLQNAAMLANGTVPTARLGSGTADATTALFGDQTYKTIVSNGTVSIVDYSSTQTITIPTGATRAKVTLWGATGGSGGVIGAGLIGCASVASAGAAGAGALLKYLTGLVAGRTLSLTLGAAGTAGNTSGSSGGAGGNSTLATGPAGNPQTITTLTANGGAAGAGVAIASLASIGGAGGTASNGDRNITGQPGGNGTGGDTVNPIPQVGDGGVTGFGLSSGAKGVSNTGSGVAGIVGIIGGCTIEWYS